MSKKQVWVGRVRPKARWHMSRVAALITLALVCVISTSLLAQVTTNRKKSKDSTSEFTAQSFSASAPSKEYIYVGSKLVATREKSASSNSDDAEAISVCVHD